MTNHIWVVLTRGGSFVYKCHRNNVIFITESVFFLSCSDNSSSWDNYQSGESPHFLYRSVRLEIFAEPFVIMLAAKYWFLVLYLLSLCFCTSLLRILLLWSSPLPSPPPVHQVDVAPIMTWVALSSPHKWRSLKMWVNDCKIMYKLALHRKASVPHPLCN